MFPLVFVCFRFTEISYLLNFPSNKIVSKLHLSLNVYPWVNMNFLYTIAVRKDEVFYVTQTSDFSLVLLKGKIKFATSYCSENKPLVNFIEGVYIFPLISSRKCNQRIEDLFFLLHGNKCSFIMINLLKVFSQKLGY